MSPCCASWIKSENCSSLVDQPLPTLKESGGLNFTEWYSPGCRASAGYSGRGRALAASCVEPPLQALSASATPPTTSTATNMGAANRSLRPIRPPPSVIRGAGEVYGLTHGVPVLVTFASYSSKKGQRIAPMRDLLLACID